jgi:type IV pilus assembly protein PilX
MKNAPRHTTMPRSARAQRGVVLLFALVALLVLMIGAVALVRSFNSTLFNAGNIAFKKDLQNQSERAAARIMTALDANGALSSTTIRATNRPDQNYRAQKLDTNEKGIPLALLTDGAFNAVANAANDFDIDGQHVKIRYVVDRLCWTEGDETLLGARACVVASGSSKEDGSADDPRSIENGDAMPRQSQIVYRLSIRATGPRNTQAYFQSTFAL